MLKSLQENTTLYIYIVIEIKHGQAMLLTKGKLQIQSEGAEVFYKDIKIQPVDQLPIELLKK